jgi:hypothetical protein
LARDIGRTDRCVQTAIKTAVQADELKCFYNYGPNGVNVYEIPVERLRSYAESSTGEKSSPGEESSHEGSSLNGEFSYSSLRSLSSSKPETVKPSESVSMPKPRSWGRWAKRGEPDWQCPICLHVGCPGCPGYVTDGELNASFDAATLDAGMPGPAKLVFKDGAEFGHGEIAPLSLEQEQVARERATAEWDDYENGCQKKLKKSQPPASADPAQKSSAPQSSASPALSREPGPERVAMRPLRIPGRRERSDAECQ